MRLRISITALLFCLLASCFANAQGLPLTGIAHAAFRVSDLGSTREFYRKLGFAQAFEFTEAGKTTQAFIKINDRQFVELYPKTEDSQTLGLMHVCYEASDIAYVHDDYAKAGLSPTDVKKARAGNLLFVLHDPDGQLVEYTQYMPGSLHTEDRGKHLGSHRLSEHLVEASLLVKDAEAERAFYANKLGFALTDSDAGVRIPGMEQDEIHLISPNANNTSQITFAVKDIKQAEKSLRKQGVQLQAGPRSIQIHDPDGNAIAFSVWP